jgi:tetraacyldisaccharide 4'-kinase
LLVRLDEPAWWYGDGTSLPAACLAPLAALYGWAARARYERAEPYRARLPVVCIGNLTTGGTGKTPLVLYLCERLRAGGLRPAVLTRGYGGSRAGPHWVAEGDRAEAVGDEALLLGRAAPTLVARDRAAGARFIEREIERAQAAGTVPADLILMDDGLQNPQLAKDLTLAVVDGARGLGNGRVMPAGPLRAPLGFQLALVDAIVVNEPTPGAGDAVAERLQGLFNGPVLRCATVVAGDPAWLEGRRVIAWAGIGAPHRFFALLQRLGAELVETVAFADHHPLNEADARRLLGLAAQHGAALVSTEKDMARLEGAAGGALADLGAAAQALPIRPAFAEPDAERLAGLLRGTIARTTHR